MARNTTNQARRNAFAVAIAAGVGATLGFAALAQNTKPNDPPVIETLISEGVEIRDRFEGPDGLRGYVVSINGRLDTAYTTESGAHLILGTHVDADGMNRSREPIETVANAPRDPSEWAALDNAAWVSEGESDAERVVYVFTDPNCPYCNRFNEAARAILDEGAAVEIRHIMVGVIRPESLAQSAAILAADEPAALLKRQNNAFDQGEGIEVDGNSDTAPVERNNALMRELGISGTPAVYYRDEGGAIRRASGLPDADTIREILTGTRGRT